MPLNEIFGNTVKLLEKNLDLRTRNHNLISANLANAETPGYIPTSLSFQEQLKQAVKANDGRPATPALTNPRHLPLHKAGSGIEKVQGQVVETPAKTIGKDGNGVELENEMSKMLENQLMYNASVQLLSKKFEVLKYAVKGGV